MSIQLSHTLEPVTALEFCSTSSVTLLLVGEGPYLIAFEINSWNLLFKCKAFDDQVVHGIAVQDDVSCDGDLQLVIWGGACLNFLKAKDLERLISGETSIVNSAVVAPDWILDAAISSKGFNRCAAVTAHNTLFLVNFSEDPEAASAHNTQSPLQSILYSAHVIFESPARLLVAAGTVFGDVVVWGCSIEDCSPSDVQLLHVFKGHEGSVFGVNISAPILGHDGRTLRLVASCSDDRTIRVWDIVDSLTDRQQNHGSVSNELSLLGETGFRHADTIQSTASTDARVIAVVMGHTSRIWRVRFSIQRSTAFNLPNIFIFSFGEDTAVQKWQLEFGSSPQTGLPQHSQATEDFPAHLNQKETFAFHNGKNIWSAALHQLTKKWTVIATGGADGKISIIGISSESSPAPPESKRPGKDELPDATAQISAYSSSTEKILDLLDILHSLQTASFPEPPPQAVTGAQLAKGGDKGLPYEAASATGTKGNEAPTDAFNRYAFVSENELLLTTTFGRVLLGQIGDRVIWEELLLPDSGKHDLRSYTMVKGFPEIRIAFVAGSTGCVYMYQAGAMLTEVGVIGSKAADMFGVFDHRTGSFDLLITTLAPKSITLFHFTAPLTENTVFSAPSTCQVPQSFVVTSAGRSETLLILGSRIGSLAVYDTEYSEKIIGLWEPENSGSADAVTSITPLRNSGKEHREGRFFTTRRDGVYSIFAWVVMASSDAPVTVTLYPIHQGSPSFGLMIQAGWFSGSDFYLYGFRGGDFVVWNVTQQFEVASVTCGGVHRSYAYCAPQIGDISHFVYTKASKLHLYSQRGSSHQIARKGGHGREIKVCAVSGDRKLIATGAEDTVIRLWRLEEGGSKPGHRFDCVAVLKHHVTGIQSLRWHGSRYLFSSGGNGEFFIWAIEDVPGFGIAVLKEACCPTQNQDGDLRITGFDTTTSHEHSESATESKLLVSLAYSDSTIRTYSYTRSTGFILLARGTYTTSSLVHLSHLQISNGKLVILTAATDGRIVFWKIPVNHFEGDTAKIYSDEAAIISTRQLHHSSIKSVDWAFFGSQNYIILATGGDDGALGISIYQIDSLSSPHTFASCNILRSAHAAAITGLCVLPGKRCEDGIRELRVVSSSNDQRVKEWSVKVDVRGGPNVTHGYTVAIRKVGDTFTAVADVGDLALLNGNRENGEAQVLVVGVGMEVLDVSCDVSCDVR